MSLYKGSTLIAGGRQSMPLLSFMWADHQLNDMSWLRADTFSWQSGDVYKAAYQHLVKDICAQYWGTNPDGTGLVVFTKALEEISIGSSVYDTDLTTVLGTITAIDTVNNTITVSSDNPSINTTFYNGGLHPTTLTESVWETINGITIRSFIASDGHKICLANEETDIDAVYNATGVAWYYILDTENKRFKLPRTQFAFTGLRDTVGNYIEAGLPNITATWRSSQDLQQTGAAYRINTSQSGYGGSKYGSDTGFDASRSSSIYGNSDTVQPKATEMYLYFYIGNFTQTATENTAGLNAEMFNDLNAHKVIEFQEPTAANGYTWYRKYADGWVEQGGVEIASGAIITLPIAMADTKYTVQTTPTWGTANSSGTRGMCSYLKTTTSFNAQQDNNSGSFDWQVSGIAAN